MSLTIKNYITLAVIAIIMSWYGVSYATPVVFTINENDPKSQYTKFPYLFSEATKLQYSDAAISKLTFSAVFIGDDPLDSVKVTASAWNPELLVISPINTKWTFTLNLEPSNGPKCGKTEVCDAGAWLFSMTATATAISRIDQKAYTISDTFPNAFEVIVKDIPEPTTIALIGLGIGVMAACRIKVS